MKRRSGAGGKLQGRKRSTPKRRNAPKAMHDRGVSISGQETKVTRLERDLNEAWEQQTATSEILKIISSLPTSVQAVLDTVVASAARLCQALNATIYLRDGDVAVIHAQFGYGGSPVGTRRPLDADWVTGRAVLETRTIHVPDLLNSDEYPKARGISLPLGYRALLAVPLMRNKTAVGAILATRREARPFTDRQIALLQNFADQAVIAIENARLLNELRHRTSDLTESLEQQTGTSKVLEAISSSPGDLKPVFEAILENAVRLCGAKFGNLYLREGDGLRAAAMHNAPPAYAEQRAGILHPSPNTSSYRAIQTKQPAQVVDITKLQAYVEGDPWLTSAVPVCWSRDSVRSVVRWRSSLSSRVFSMAMTACFAKFVSSSICLSENVHAS